MEQSEIFYLCQKHYRVNELKSNIRKFTLQNCSGLCATVYFVSGCIGQLDSLNCRDIKVAIISRWLAPIIHHVHMERLHWPTSLAMCRARSSMARRLLQPRITWFCPLDKKSRQCDNFTCRIAKNLKEGPAGTLLYLLFLRPRSTAEFTTFATWNAVLSNSDFDQIRTLLTNSYHSGMCTRIILVYT